jgi:hypothetical protein
MPQNSPVLLSAMKLCLIIVLDEFLDMGEVLSEFFRKSPNGDQLFRLELFFHFDELDGLVQQRFFRILDKQTVVV